MKNLSCSLSVFPSGFRGYLGPLRLGHGLKAALSADLSALEAESAFVMRLIDRMELPSTSAERTASFFSMESVYISAPQFPLDGRVRQADNPS